MNGQRHSIGKCVLDFRFSSESIAKELLQEIPAVVNDVLANRLDPVFNELTRNGKTILIDRLTIDLGNMDPQSFKERFAGELLFRVNQQVKAIVFNLENGYGPGDGTDARQVSNEDLLFEAFLGFLSEGRYPWWMDVPALEMLEFKLIALAEEQKEKFLTGLKKNLQRKVACDRMAFQFSDKFSMRLIKLFFPDGMADISLVHHHITEVMLHDETVKDKHTQENMRLIAIAHLWYHLFRHDFLPDVKTLAADIITTVSADTGLDRSGLEARLPVKLRKGANLGPDRLKQMENRFALDKSQSESVPAEIYIENSGLIILSPYLEKFLEQLDLVRGGDFRNDASRHTAILLMHYLSMGNQVFNEHQLTLNKLLAGWPIDKPVNRHHRLNEKQKAECNGLLKAAIGHWDVLKNTSVKGLQESFLRRNGKLSPAPDGWILRVEQKGIDVLLEKLPWSYRIVRLPWMNGILHVEW